MGRGKKPKRDTKRDILNLPTCTEYQIWRGMWLRCYDPDCKAYERYGARGIRICERWRDFFAFIADVGRRPSLKHSIDRIESTGNYEPENVKWSTAQEQSTNRCNVHKITIDGVMKSHKEWCKIYGVNRDNCLRRYHECGDFLKAVELVKQNRNEPLQITINGETRTLKGWAKLCGIKAKTIWQRITKEGVSPEEAISRDTHYLNHPRTILVTIDGVTNSVVGWCKYFKMPRSRARHRYEKLGDWNKVFEPQNRIRRT